MKKWPLAAALMLFLLGCAGEQEGETASAPKENDRPLVYAANYPLKYFAERISTPLVEVRFPVPADVDPAFWNPTPEDVQALQKADLVLLNGASYESWLKNVSLPTSRLVDTSEGFQDRFIAEVEATTHSHGLEGEHEHAETAFTTWLDLTLAVEQARAVKDAFSTRLPKHQGQFEAQFDTLAEELEAMDGKIQQIVAGNPGVPVLFSHPVYQYFAHRYGLNGRSLHWEPYEMPSDAMWRELAVLLEAHPAQWMIWEGEPSQEITAKLAERGIRSVVFDPCGGAPEGGDFASVMKGNMAALETVYSKSRKGEHEE